MLLSFDYTDSKGKQSQRVAMALNYEANEENGLFCIDLTDAEMVRDMLEELEPYVPSYSAFVEEALFAYVLERLHAGEDLGSQFKSLYRNFKPERMTKVKDYAIEYIEFGFSCYD